MSDVRQTKRILAEMCDMSARVARREGGKRGAAFHCGDIHVGMIRMVGLLR